MGGGELEGLRSGEMGLFEHWSELSLSLALSSPTDLIYHSRRADGVIVLLIPSHPIRTHGTILDIDPLPPLPFPSPIIPSTKKETPLAHHSKQIKTPSPALKHIPLPNNNKAKGVDPINSIRNAPFHSIAVSPQPSERHDDLRLVMRRLLSEHMRYHPRSTVRDRGQV